MRGNTKKNLSDINLIQLLRDFSTQEMKEFERFVNSPYFNTQRPVSDLAELIKNFHSKFDSDDFTREKLFAVICNGRQYDDQLFRKYLSNLLKLAEEFLVISEVRQQRTRWKITLLDQLERRNQFSLFGKLLRDIESDASAEDEITNESFYYKHFREELKSSIEIRRNNLHLIKSSLLKAHTYLLMHVLQTGTVYGNMMLVNRKSFKEREEGGPLEEFYDIRQIVNYLKKSAHLSKTEKKFVSLCELDLMLASDPLDKGLLSEMRASTMDLSENLNKNLLYIYFSHLNIYYLLNISAGSVSFESELLNNYKFMVERDLYMHGEKEYINFSEYRTILVYALKLGEIKWSEELIEKFKDFHGPGLKSNILNYSYALLNFEKGLYDESLKYLSKLKQDNIIIRLDSDVLYIMNYYEKDFLESALSAAESFKYFVNSSNVLSSEVVRSQLEFARHARFLIKTKFSRLNEFEYEKRKSEIESFAGLRRKKWLLDNLDKIYTLE